MTNKWDQTVKGLHTRNEKSYFLYYRTKKGTQRRPKIGDLNQITLGEARRRAKAILDRVAIGEDPKGQWDTSKKEITVNELFDQTWEFHWDNARFHKSGHAYEVKRNYETNIKPEFGVMKINDVSAPTVKRWHSKFKDRVYAGNRSVEILTTMFNFAISEGILTNNPCSNIKSHKERKRTRYATSTEIQLLTAALNKRITTNREGVTFIYLCLLTGARPRSIERARREDLSIRSTDAGEVGILTFSGKTTENTGSKEVLVIPSVAMGILSGVTPPRDGTLLGIKTPNKLWKSIVEEIGAPDLWLRDCRRTFATVGLSSGQNVGVISELLNHQSTQTTKLYAKLIESKRIEVATLISERIMG